MRRSSRFLVAAVAALTLGAAACSSDGTPAIGSLNPSELAPEDPAAPPAEEPPAEQPPAEEPPAEQPPAETAPPAAPEEPADGGDSDDSDNDWVTWLVVGGLALLAIAGIAALVSSNSKKSAATAAAASNRQHGAAQIISSSNWVHDQSITVLQISDSAQVRGAWDQMRNQIMGVEREVATAAAQPEAAPIASAMSQVGSALSGVRGALEAYVSVAASESPDSALVDNAAQTVQLRRQQLAVAVSDLAVRAGGTP